MDLVSEIEINVFVESRYPVERDELREAARTILKEHKVRGAVEVGLAVVGNRKMRHLNKKYRQKDSVTPVLAFTQQENGSGAPFLSVPDDTLRLGDVVVSFPQAREIARTEEKLVDEVLEELVKHGVEKLLGE